MTRDIIEMNNFLVVIEQSTAEKAIVDKCGFDERVIGIAFYGSGNVELSVQYGDRQKSYQNTRGFAMSFFADSKVEFVHRISQERPLQCIVIVSSLDNLRKLPNQEGEIYSNYLAELVAPQDHYVEGPNLYMTPDMESAVHKIFNTKYSGKTRMMFLRSQVTELLSHFFAQIGDRDTKEEVVREQDRQKLYRAKEILSSNIETPPSLSELSKQIGLNSYKLKKHFKALFGVPVFKYLQNERLTKAHDLLRSGDLTVQEVAWEVGYESLSSFSNAFAKKFGFRPSSLKN